MDDTTPAEGTENETEQQQAPPPEPSTEETDVDRWKRHSRFHEGQAKKHKADLDAANAELAKAREEAQSESEKALAKAREEGKAEGESYWRQAYYDTRRSSEATAMLNRSVLNPDLLLPHLDLNSIEVDDEGHVDEGAMAAAIDQLLERFPDQARPQQKQTNGSGAMDMHYRRTPTFGSGGSLESGAEMYARRHGKTS